MARLSEARNRFFARAIQATVKAPDIACVRSKEDSKEKKQGDVVEVRSEIFPERRAVAGRIPGGESERDHQDCSGHRSRPDEQSKDETQPDGKFTPGYGARAKHGMNQDKINQK